MDGRNYDATIGVRAWVWTWCDNSFPPAVNFEFPATPPRLHGALKLIYIYRRITSRHILKAQLCTTTDLPDATSISYAQESIGRVKKIHRCSVVHRRQELLGKSKHHCLATIACPWPTHPHSSSPAQLVHRNAEVSLNVLDSFLQGYSIAGHDSRGVNVVLDEFVGPFQQLRRHDNNGRGSVSNLINHGGGSCSRQWGIGQSYSRCRYGGQTSPPSPQCC